MALQILDHLRVAPESERGVKEEKKEKSEKEVGVNERVESAAGQVDFLCWYS